MCMKISCLRAISEFLGRRYAVFFVDRLRRRRAPGLITTVSRSCVRIFLDFRQMAEVEELAIEFYRPGQRRRPGRMP